MDQKFASKLLFSILFHLVSLYSFTQETFPDLNVSEISNEIGFIFNSEHTESQEFGEIVESAGDMNGDGYDDIIICDPLFNDGLLYGRAYIVFGNEQGAFPTNLDLLDGSNGFIVEGGSVDFMGYVASGGGDFNGDGFDDVVIGARSNQFGAVVIYGRNSGFPALFEIDRDDDINPELSLANLSWDKRPAKIGRFIPDSLYPFSFSHA